MSFEIEHASSPVYVSADHQAIQLVVKFSHIDDEVRFIATSNDIEPHGRMLFCRARDGEFGPVGEFIEASTDIRQELTTQLRVAVVSLLDSKARELNFDSFADALTYVDEPIVPLYQNQALALRRWRSVVWKVVEDTIESNIPFDPQTIIEQLPQFKMEI